MRSMHSAQRKVELRRLGNQLPVLGKANSFCKIVKLWGFFACLLSCDLVWAAQGPGIKISQIIVTVAKSVYRLDDVLKYHMRPLVVGKNTNSRFLARSVPLFRSLMLTPMIHAALVLRKTHDFIDYGKCWCLYTVNNVRLTTRYVNTSHQTLIQRIRFIQPGFCQ